MNPVAATPVRPYSAKAVTGNMQVNGQRCAPILLYSPKQVARERKEEILDKMTELKESPLSLRISPIACVGGLKFLQCTFFLKILKD